MYLSWDEQTVTDLSDANIADMYEGGYVFTRKSKGLMQQTRSLRVNLAEFELSSENKRVLKRVEGIEITAESLPMEYYDWSIGKLAKDFYDRFGQNIFSANKIKKLLTEPDKSNFNALLSYSSTQLGGKVAKLGYAICYAGESFLHYSYPFYSLGYPTSKDMGLGMITMASILCQEQGDQHVYLGSASRPTDTYKLQFSGLEWFNGKVWRSDYGELKKILKNG